MDTTDKQEILEAFSSLATQVNERIAVIAEDVASLRTEVRDGFSAVDKRLVSLEDNVDAMSTTLDTVLEGDALGKRNITLTRPEYDTMVDSLNLPNRFQEPQAAH